jgi:hypothetical protein
MSDISKALRAELKRQKLQHGRTYSSNSNGRRRVKIWACPRSAFSGLDFVAKQLGAIECEMISTNHSSFVISSFVAWFPLGADGEVREQKPTCVRIQKQQELPLQPVVAKTVGELARRLASLAASDHATGYWSVERGAFGHGSIIVYDKHGNELLELRNKD